MVSDDVSHSNCANGQSVAKLYTDETSDICVPK